MLERKQTALKQAMFKSKLNIKKQGKRHSLGEADLQVGGQILAWGKGMLPDHHVGYIVDGEAKLWQGCVQFIQARKMEKNLAVREQLALKSHFFQIKETERSLALKASVEVGYVSVMKVYPSFYWAENLRE